MTFEWILPNIEIIITLVVAPLLAWLFYERHVQKINIKKMKKDLEATDVNIEQEKWAAMQKQIDVYANLVDNLRKHSEDMLEIYDKAYKRLQADIKEMKENHDRERTALLTEIETLTKDVERLKKELNEMA